MSATRGTEPAGDAGTSARTERWRVLVPYLDRALELEGEDRSAWLQELRAEDEALAAEVDALLERHHTLRAERFLDGGPLVRPAVSLAGQVLGAYRLVSRIGQGGMGTVWRADRCDGRFRGQAAVKILNASLVGRDGEQRFRREGSILARLRHPHIARLIDAGVSLQGQPYLVLEHVQGEHLDAYCDTRRMGVEARLRLFLDVLSAVANAHANLVVHRDLKPSNVLVDADGQVKLLDFGIAKLLEDDADVVAVVTRETPMTPAYAAPEQLTGGDVTTATDVYALGALLYVLLVGRHPARDPAISPAELVRAVVDADAAPPSEVALAGPSTLERAGERGTTPARLRKALRGDLDNIVAKALKKRPGERYASVEAMADDLRRHLAHEPVSARPDSIRYRAARFLRRHRLGVAAAAVVVASLAAGLGATAWQAAQARRAAARAQAVTEFVVGLFELSNPSRPQSEQVTARQLLDRGVQRLDADLQDQPELRASLLGVLGRVHASLGLYDQAADLLGRSEALISRHRPGDDAERARILSELADVRRSSSDYVQAAKLAREALAIQKRVHGGDHADTAMMLDRLGGVLSDQGQRAEAASAYREALAMRRRLHGDTHREVVASLNHVAGVLFEDGDYAGAEATYREALTIARSLPGDSYPSVPWSMGNVAAALYKRGKAAEAEVLLRESLRLFRERLGNRHPELTPFLRHLATALRAQGKMREATSFYEETLSIQREVYGDAHHEVAKTTHDLATLLHTQGRLREAEARHRECLQILRQLLPPNHPHLGRAMAGLARVRADQGEHAEAEALFREAVAILEKGLAPGHPLTAEARAGLDRAVLAQHRRLASASAGRGR